MVQKAVTPRGVGRKAGAVAGRPVNRVPAEGGIEDLKLFESVIPEPYFGLTLSNLGLKGGRRGHSR